MSDQTTYAPINLTKGARINLTKDHALLTRIRFALGWEPNSFDTGADFDLDASVFILRSLGGNMRLIDENHMVFYNNPADPAESVVHSGDNLDGSGDSPFKEEITVDLTKISSLAAELSFVVTIEDFKARKQNFGQVKNSFVALINDATGVEIARYSLEDDFSNETAVQFGSLYKKDDEWSFKAVGAGYNRGLADFVVAYGMTVKA